MIYILYYCSECVGLRRNRSYVVLFSLYLQYYYYERHPPRGVQEEESMRKRMHPARLDHVMR